MGRGLAVDRQVGGDERASALRQMSIEKGPQQSLPLGIQRSARFIQQPERLARHGQSSQREPVTLPGRKALKAQTGLTLKTDLAERGADLLGARGDAAIQLDLQGKVFGGAQAVLPTRCVSLVKQTGAPLRRVEASLLASPKDLAASWPK
jgi:hypothetical protein